MKHLFLLGVSLASLFSTFAHAQLVSGDSVTATYGGYTYYNEAYVDGGVPVAPPPNSTGTVGGAPLITTFLDSFAQQWDVTSTFTGNQLVVAFSSPNDPVTANESSGPGLFTIDFSFGSSVVNGTTLASYVPGPYGSAPGYLDPIVSSGPHDAVVVVWVGCRRPVHV